MFLSKVKSIFLLIGLIIGITVFGAWQQETVFASSSISTIQTTSKLSAINITSHSDHSNILSGKDTIVHDSRSKSVQQEITTIKWHMSQEYIDGYFRFAFYVDEIVGDPLYALDIQLDYYHTSAPSDPFEFTQLPTISKVGLVTTGLVGSTDVIASTTFWAVGGVYLAEAADGSAYTKDIPIGDVELQNKIGQDFPIYIDPLSTLNAANIRTDWVKTGSIAWNGRPQYINWYNATYGVQTDDWWSAREIRHIQPREYGGQNVNENLMPIPILEHSLISKWFINY